MLAAWGKACLKAGCFKQAREKFAHCFKSALNVCAEVTEDCEIGKEASESQFINRRLHSMRYSERTSSMSSVQSDGRPRSNPPLLNEIICMLEDMNYPVNQQLLNKAETIKVCRILYLILIYTTSIILVSFNGISTLSFL